MTVSQSAEEYRYINNIGSYVGKWKNSTVPYMIEPMDMLNSRTHESVVLVAGAQTGKTDSLVINWSLYSIVVDPMDMLLFCPTMTAARDFSARRIDRMHRSSKIAGKQLRKTADADNKFDKHYLSGMMLTLSYPSVTEMAGRPVGRVALTDFDRMPDDVGGDGNPFDLASKRTTTFGSFAMTMAESSPSRPVTNPNWISQSPHEAPPCTGILSLYNRGDRRRWYWPCPHCNEYFEGNFSHLSWTELDDPVRSSETVVMVCPKNGCVIHYEERHEMQQWGMWLRDGQSINEKGHILGVGRTSKIASFWLKGVAATFVSWKKLVFSYITALDECNRTGDETALQKFFNNDLAEPYIPRSLLSMVTSDQLLAKAEETPYDLMTEQDIAQSKINRLAIDSNGKPIHIIPQVPEGVRFLIANVDVQKNSFVVQVHGILPGSPFDMITVDRFSIFKSDRIDEQGDVSWIKPASYLEDWAILETEVMNRTYKLSDGSNRVMRVKLTTCDSGGKEGVTAMAYNFYRKLRAEGKTGRFHLIKGNPSPNSPTSFINYPDSSKKDKLSPARGDVPVMMLNSNLLKDTLYARFECITPTKGMYRFSSWLPEWWYNELCSETRSDKGWQSQNHIRNEAWDLSYYCIGICTSSLINVGKIEWNKPPLWAQVWDKNQLVVSAESKSVEVIAKPNYDYSESAKKLA